MEEDKHTRARRAAEAGGGAGPGTGLRVGGGTVMALVLSLILLVASLVLGLTAGVGFIFTVPLVILALAIPLVALRGVFSPRKIGGPCPHCGRRVEAAENIAELSCPACGGRIEVGEAGFRRSG